MTSPPIRDLNNYEKVVYVDSVPRDEGCYLFGAGTQKDAWLEVHRQVIQPCPQPEESFKGWLKSFSFNEINSEPEVYAERLANMETDEAELFTDDSARVSAYEEWLVDWHKWAYITSRQREIQALYMDFFALFQRLQREGESFEILFGQGILHWRHPQNATIRHPMLVTKVELQFEPKVGHFYLIPTQRGTVVETEMLVGVDIPNIKHINEIKQSFDATGISIVHEESVASLYMEISQTLDPNGTYVDTSIVGLNEFPQINHRPVIIVRQRSAQLWKQELSQTIDAIEQGIDVPKTIQSLLQVEPIQHTESEKRHWNSVGQELLFPLPANEDQKEIARRLATNFGVVVQGPPGTGKSHTIANLISHLLAHGKTVLVASHTERALRVLADKIPKEIRPLCVPVLGGDGKSLQEIENSVDALSDQMAMLDKDHLTKEIMQLTNVLSETRRRIATLSNRLRDSAKNEHESLTVDGMEFKPLDAAQWLVENEQHNWLPDRIGMSTNAPLTQEEVSVLWNLRQVISKDDVAQVSKLLPNPNDLRSPGYFKEWVDAGNQLEQRSKQAQKHVEQYQLSGTREQVDTLLNDINGIVMRRALLETKHLRPIMVDVMAGGERRKTWEQLCSDARTTIDELTPMYRETSGHVFGLPPLPNLEMEEHLKVIEERLVSHKGFGMMFKLTGRKYLPWLENGVIDNRPVQSLDDIVLIRTHLLYREKMSSFIRKWNALLKDVNGPLLDTAQARWIAELADILSGIEQGIKLADDIEKLKQSLTKSTVLPSTFNLLVVDDLLNLQTALEEKQWVFKAEDWKKVYDQLHVKLKSECGDPNNADIWYLFYSALSSRDTIAWEVAYKELMRLRTVQEEYIEFRSYMARIEFVLPNWSHYILENLGGLMEPLGHWELAWRYSRIYSWITDLEQNKPEVIQRELDDLLAQEKKIISELVAVSTWKSQMERVTEPQKRALQAWKQKIKRIGKGTGKYADRYRQEARAEMEQCSSAIPVWIMPTDRVIENFSVEGPKFDVVIIDESSQCDLFSLSVLMRGHKAVVVGDDEQISPSAVGVDQSMVHSLMQRYLDGVPQANSLDMQTSLYDVAVRVFPGKLMLKEHFRCVPEIIQFSNDLSYNGEIVPLRLPTSAERIEPPVLAIHVDGYRSEGAKPINEVEADTIVSDIEAILRDPVLEGQSIGVISLQQDEQARYIENRLREFIGEEQMIERRIVCGDAYAFQGDERDIIFLSMVAAPNVRFQALTKREYQQRFNVAASRARNQLRLYHSVQLNDLNPEDMRYRLIQYCNNPMRVTHEYEALEELCESQFERDVLRMILSKGYTVRPQIHVGRKRIDLVVEGLTARLAVECDGDKWHGIDKWEEDMERQRVLERAGWVFWRVRGSAFYRERAKAMESLWSKLDDMKIEKRLLLDENVQDEVLV